MFAPTSRTENFPIREYFVRFKESMSLVEDDIHVCCSSKTLGNFEEVPGIPSSPNLFFFVPCVSFLTSWPYHRKT